MTASASPIGEDDLQAHVDGRLTPERYEEVEAYLAEHPEIATRLQVERRQRDALRAALHAKYNEPIPSRLRISAIRAQRKASGLGRMSRIAASLALFVSGVGAGYLASAPHRGAATVPDSVSIVSEAVQAYRTYVVEVVHPVEVGANNEAHLVKWLSKRLGRTLRTPDLARYGYHLMGGRLLPAPGGVGAQLMYEDESGKRLTVYICSGDDGQTAFHFAKDGEVSTFSWLDQGFGFAVSASLDRDRLLQMSRTIYQDLEDMPPPKEG